MADSASPSSVKAQLDRILSSESFAGSDQLKRFLKVTVERTLAGDTGQLKEYTLGIDVFNRPEDYDPKVDPIVRVQARRVRAKLEEYYRREGRDDSTLIHLPKGGYVPVFEEMPERQPKAHKGIKAVPAYAWAVAALFVSLIAAAALAWYAKPVPPSPLAIAVLPLENLTGDPGRQFLADKLTEGLITELAKNPKLQVRSRTSAMQYRQARKSLPEIARALNVSTIVEGGFASDGERGLIKIRAVHAAADRKIWAQSYECSYDELSAVQSDIARSVAAAILTTAEP
ncbi:MAG: hypothetical protein ACRD7E_14700 [Bryobacteraceae bacterium]